METTFIQIYNQLLVTQATMATALINKNYMVLLDQGNKEKHLQNVIKKLTKDIQIRELTRKCLITKQIYTKEKIWEGKKQQ